MDDNQLISVVMPAHNASLYVEESINSILQQTYTNIELIIVDDGSTDNTKAIILSYEDKRIRFVRNISKRGISYSLNKAISMAKGKYIARMDADDIATPDRLFLQLDYLKLNNLDICGSGITTFGFSDRVILYPESMNDIQFFSLFGSPMAHPTVFGLSSLFKKYAYRDVVAEDYELWTRMLMNGVVIGNIQKSLLNYRVHSTQLTSEKGGIINSSIGVARKYANNYIKKDGLKNDLDELEYFMGGRYSLNTAIKMSKRLVQFAERHNVTESMKSRIVSIIFSRVNCYNFKSLISYVATMKSLHLSSINNFNIKLMFLFLFFLDKDSNIALFIRRLLSR